MRETYFKYQADCFYQQAIEKNLQNLPLLSAQDIDLIEIVKKEG